MNPGVNEAMNYMQAYIYVGQNLLFWRSAVSHPTSSEIMVDILLLSY